MNAEERQALREKHHRDQYGLCAGCGSRTLDGGTSTIEWKFCDVIKLLDAWQGQTEELLAIIYDTNAITHADSVEAMRRILTGTATENLKSSDLENEVECDHWYSVMSLVTSPLIFVTTKGSYAFDNDCFDERDTNPMEFEFCPKCGEKL